MLSRATTPAELGVEAQGATGFWKASPTTAAQGIGEQ